MSVSSPVPGPVTEKSGHSFRQSHSYAALLLVLSMLFLSANHVVGRWVHEDIPPVGLAFWRWLAGALMILPFIWSNRRQSFPIMLAGLKPLALLGALVGGSTAIILIALNFTTAVNVSLINATQPTITVFLSWLFLKERLTRIQLSGVVVAFAGVVVMLSKGSWQALAGLELNLGDLIALFAMFGFASYSINIKNIPAQLSTLEALFAIIMIGCALLLPFYLLETVFYRPMPVTGTAITVVLVLALFVAVLGMVTWNIGNQMLGPATASVFINLIPVFGAILAVMFLGEEFLSYHMVGAILVCFGMLMVLAHKWRVQTQQKSKGADSEYSI